VKVLYFLERSSRDVEVFIAREIREVLRQGVLAEAVYPSGSEYRHQRAEAIVALGPADGGAGERVPPRSSAGAMARAAALSPSGAMRASAHARGPGAGLGSGFRQAVSLAGLARRTGADLLHAHFAAKACEDAMLASWISGIPFTFTAHGYDVHLQPPSDYGTRGESAAAVVTVSGDNARVLAGRCGVPRDRIHVIPLGVDTDRFKPGGVQEDGLVVAVMRLHEDKGPDLLLDAAGRLLARGARFCLEILGEGPARADLEKRLEGPLASRVTLAGWAGEGRILDTLRRASLFVLPSRWESQGVALMEAMACGKAIVATRVGGVPEVTADGKAALLVPPEDPGALAQAIESLLADPARRESLGRAARERVIEAYRLDRSVASLRELWGKAAPGGRRGASRTSSTP